MKIGRGVSELWGDRKSPYPTASAYGLYKKLVLLSGQLWYLQ